MLTQTDYSNEHMLIYANELYYICSQAHVYTTHTLYKTVHEDCVNMHVWFIILSRAREAGSPLKPTGRVTDKSTLALKPVKQVT